MSQAGFLNFAPSRLRRERDLPANKKSYGEHIPKPDVVVVVVRVVPVTVRTAHVPRIIVPRAAAPGLTQPFYYFTLK
ncbi:MAG: hypothetical protein WCI88_11535 [Chloroflexota bacterium]